MRAPVSMRVVCRFLHNGFTMNNAIARRYAHALFCLVSRDDYVAAQEGLQALSHALKDSAALKHSLASPAVTREEKLDMLTALCERAGGPPVLGRFCKQLLKNNRMASLPDIAEAFRALLAQHSGERRVAVVSAQPMDEDMKRDLLGRLRTTLNSKVDVDFQSDPSLLAGLQIHIGSTVYDSTVRGQLNRIRTQLVKG